LEVRLRRSRRREARADDARALIGRTMAEAYPGVEHTSSFELLRRCMEERSRHVLENQFTFPDG
jgi:hypothetical protein